MVMSDYRQNRLEVTDIFKNILTDDGMLLNNIKLFIGKISGFI